jgi:paraquat-inducible protein B
MKKSAFGYDKVAEICRKLIEQGETPTLRSVRDGVGIGSMSTISKYLHQWQKEYALSTTVDDDLSAEFRQAVLAECARKLNTVKARLQAKIDEHEAQISELQEILGTAETKLDELTNELEKTKKEYEHKYLEYERKLSAATEQVIVRTEYAHEITHKTDKELAQLREELLRMQEARHQADIKAATAEARNAELEKQLRK